MEAVFFGSGKYVLPILEVIKNNFKLALIVTTERKPESPVPAFCLHNDIPFISVSRKEDLLSVKKIASGSDIAFLANFRLIIPQSMLSDFKLGIINIHPSLLPKYRGATPGQTAILNGDTSTGVSLMKLDKEVDHGPILASSKEEIKSDDTTDSLYQRLFLKGSQLLDEKIKDYVKGKAELSQQNHDEASYTKLLSKEDGYFDLSSPPTPEIFDLLVRAYYPWPGVWTKTKLSGKLVIVKFLPNQRIQVEGKSPVYYKDFMNGYEEVSKNLESMLQSGN